jgi:hypothetical protein
VEVVAADLHGGRPAEDVGPGDEVVADRAQAVEVAAGIDRVRRPASAAELRDALAALDDVGAWSEREARQWWERWRRGRPERPGDVAGRATRTLAVALDRRGDEA